MRPGSLLVGAAVLVLVAAACSSASRPPEDGDCVAQPGVQCSPSTGAGGNGNGGDASVACAADAGSDPCDTCLAASCCPEIGACDGSTDCVNLVNCEDGCNGAASCFGACRQQYPAGVAELDAVSSCAEARCTICAQSGVGDPCGNGAGVCVSGLACNGSFCTRPCAHDADCAGIGPGGDDARGFPNACVPVAAGDTCMPECGSTVDCADFPATYCQSTTSAGGATVSVCASLPDAAAD